MKQNKYMSGEPLESLGEVEEMIEAGLYFWWRHKPYHPRFVGAWQISMVLNLIKYGSLRRATVNPEWKPPKTKPKPRIHRAATPIPLLLEGPRFGKHSP